MLEQEILAAYFPLDKVEENTDFEQFRRLLIQEITALITYDIAHLAQIMYRIDVAEDAFQEALYTQDAVRLADLAIQRVQQKIAFRQNYKTI